MICYTTFACHSPDFAIAARRRLVYSSGKRSATRHSNANPASPVPEGLFRQFVGRFAFQHRPDNDCPHQVEDSQYRKQWAETDGIRQRTHHQRKQGTCGPVAIPVRPLAVATSLRPNTSDERVISAPDNDW